MRDNERGQRGVGEKSPEGGSKGNEIEEDDNQTWPISQSPGLGPSNLCSSIHDRNHGASAAWMNNAGLWAEVLLGACY